MRLAVNGETWDRCVPIFVLPYAVWTVYVHLIVAAHASFTTLLHWLPLVLLIAVAATIVWFRLPRPARPFEPAETDHGGDASAASAKTARGSNIQAAPFAVLALAVLWTGLLSAGMSYQVFWWGALLAMCGAWVSHLRGRPHGPQGDSAGKHPAWIVPCVVVAAVCITLVANRPDADDAFYLSIPATLLRLPQLPVLLQDTMYRLPEAPVMLPFYRLSSYGVLIGTLSRITGINHLVIAYLVLPSFLAALCVLAWVYLLRRLVPARWTSVLLILFLCVLTLGEVHRAYGNFALVRMFQGKAILATCMVPVITGSALMYARHGGMRHWLLLFAAQIAALGVTASALFVAPAAAALGLAGGWSADATRSRRFVVGMLATVYLLGAAWVMASGTHGGQVLSVASPHPMPSVPQILDHTWGRWSTRLLLVVLLASWAFVRDPVRARYFSAGAFFFLLAALNPYTVRFVADHSVGVETYWRLTWALPLPFFLAVILDDVIRRVPHLKSKALAVCLCLVLAALAAVFGWRFGTLLCANSVTLGTPGPKVPPVEYGVARRVAEQIPEESIVLAPEAVATWLPTFVVHPKLIGVRQMYLSLAFTPQETAQRSNMMRYVAGKYRPHDATTWFAESIRRFHVTAVVFTHSALWSKEIEMVLGSQGWQPLSCGTYEIWMKVGHGSATTKPSGCEAQLTPGTVGARTAL